MSVAVARSLDEAVDARARDPEAHLLAGGTDFMVEVNFGHRRPPSVVALSAVPELRGWARAGDRLVLGAGLTYTEMQTPEPSAALPALAQAARTVGSPQIRNAGTLGGNLGTASPAGDTLPVLAALDADVTVVGPDGERSVPWDRFLTGPKRTSLAPGEIIRDVRVRVPVGPQEFLKVGTRNAMVISIAGLALVVDTPNRTVRCALGSVGPVPIRATDAEVWLETRVSWGDRPVTDTETIAEFARRVADAARPIDDHRSTAEYRRHAVRVLAARAATRALT